MDPIPVDPLVELLNTVLEAVRILVALLPAVSWTVGGGASRGGGARGGSVRAGRATENPGAPRRSGI